MVAETRPIEARRSSSESRPFLTRRSRSFSMVLRPRSKASWRTSTITTERPARAELSLFPLPWFPLPPRQYRPSGSPDHAAAFCSA